MFRSKQDEKPLLPPPAHVALIMDGNGRWAKERNLPRQMGHQAGLEAMRRIIRCADELGIRVVTFYAFSTENWSRPQDEVDFLMQLPIRFIEQDLPQMMKNNVKITLSGRREGIPEKTWQTIQRACRDTEANTSLVVNLAFNYGGRSEIVDALRSIADKIAAGELSAEQIDEQLVSQHLYQPQLPDPDLIIRSAGEMRLSNFLMWESAYSEFYAWPSYWPEFNRAELEKIIEQYRRRERRYGGRAE